MKAYTISQRTTALKFFVKKENKNKAIRSIGCSLRSLFYWAKQQKEQNNLSPNYHAPFNNSRGHTADEVSSIDWVLKTYPTLSIISQYSHLKNECNYKKHYHTFRKFVLKNYTLSSAKNNGTTYKPKPYYTTRYLGIKWQMDVKYVPTACYGVPDGQKFYQYTMIDEHTRKRFIFAYNEHSGFSTFNFILRCFDFFGMKPLVIQTDNGSEFTNPRSGKNATTKTHLVDYLLNKFHIYHKLNRVATPRHNGKVERSHREDQKFYNTLKFRTLNELQLALSKHLENTNNTVHSALNFISPNEQWKKTYLCQKQCLRDNPKRYRKDWHKDVKNTLQYWRLL